MAAFRPLRRLLRSAAVPVSNRWTHRLPLRLELLEAREVPAVITFTGATNSSWHTATNWDLARVPTAGDEVVIPDVASVAAVTFSSGTTAVNSVTSAERLNLAGGSLSVSAASQLNAGLTTSGSGTLGGTGSFTVSGTTAWGGGTISGSFTNAGTLTTTGALNLTNGTLTNLGTITLGNANVAFTGNATLINEAGATLNATTDADFTTFSTGTKAIVNRGTFQKTAGTAQTLISVPFENAGAVAVQTGELRWGNPLTAKAGGTYTVAAGATLTHNASTSVFEADTVIGGGGAFNITGGSITLANGAALTLAVPSVSWSSISGTLGGTGSLFIPIGTTANWVRGTITVPLSNAGTLSLTETSLTGTSLVNTGALSVGAAVTLTGTSITNETGATLALTNGGDFARGIGDSLILNRGRITSAGSASNPSIVFVPIDNSGAIDVLSGEFQSRIGDAGIISRNGATYSIAAGAVLRQLSLWDWRASGVVTGDGKLIVDNGDISVPSGVAARYELPVGGFEFQSGFLVGSGTIQVSASTPFLWSGGALQTSLEIAGTTTVTGTPVIEGGALVNTGTVLMNGSIQYHTSGSITNESGGVIDFRTDGDVTALNAGTKTLTNRGRLVKSAGTGESTLSVAVANTGTIEANSGTLGFNQPLVQTAGRTHLGGGTIRFTGGELRLDGGELTGTGSVQGTVNNVAGAVKPGNSPGILTFTTYTQQAAGALEIEIGGATPGTQHDRLAVTGAATLNGTLKIVPLSFFDPPLNGTYTIVTHGSRSGGFNEVLGQQIDASRAYTLTPSVTAITLTVASGVDLKTTAVVTPATAQPGAPVSVSYTVQNLVGTSATGPWVDSAWLSLDNFLDASDILIGTTTHTGALSAGDSYTSTITANLPAVTPGDYRVLINADAQRTNAELNPFNNLKLSSNLVRVNIPELALDTPFTGVIKSGEQKFFKLDIPAGADAIVDLSTAVAGGAELIVRYIQAPTPSNFDQRTYVATSATQQVTWTSPQSGAYYVLLVGKSPAGTAGTSYTLKGKQSLFDLLAVRQAGVDAVAKGSNQGQATVKLAGTGFTPDTQVFLVVGGTERAALGKWYQSQTSFIATFDVTGLAAGSYAVRVKKGTEVKTLASAFVVTNGPAGALSTTVSLPANMRQGGTAFATITYRNTGETDIPAPLLKLESADLKLKLAEQTGYSVGELTFLAINPFDYAGVLPPGFAHSIQVAVQHTGTDNDITLDVLEPDANAAMDWAALKSSLQPANLSDEAFDLIFANFLQEVGLTVQQYADLLRKNASYLSLIGRFTFDVDRLFSHEFLQADNFGEISSRFVTGIYGPGFADPFSEKVVVQIDGSIHIVTQTTIRIFEKITVGFRGLFNDLGKIVVQPNGAIRVVEFDGSFRQYRLDGRLDFWQDRNGYRVTYEYTAALLTAQVDSNGRRLSFEYTNGLVTRRVGWDGEPITFTYDPTTRRVLTVTDATGTTTYTYVLNGPAKGAYQTVTAPDGLITSFTYDSRGFVSAVRVNGVLMYSVVIDEFGKSTLLAADGSKSVLWRNDFGDVARVVDWAGNITSYRYDANRDVTKIFLPGNRAWSYGRNANGLVETIIDPTGAQTKIGYKSNKPFVQTTTDPTGRKTSYARDDRGNVVRTDYPDATFEEAVYDDRGNVISFTDRAGRLTTTEYNQFDLMTRRVHANGAVDMFEYDAFLRLSSFTDATGRTEIVRDLDGYVTRVLQSNSQSVTYTRDDTKQLTSITAGDGTGVRYVRDTTTKLVTRIEDELGALIAAVQYDQMRRPTRIVYANGTGFEVTINAKQQVERILHFGAGGAELGRYDYTYDALGRVKDIITPEGTSSREYDAASRIVQELLADGTQKGYGYNPDGSRSSVSTNGSAQPYSVNSIGELTNDGENAWVRDLVTNTLRIFGPNKDVTLHYDDLGRLIGITDALAGTDTRWQLNALGQQVKVTKNGVETDITNDFVNGRPLAEFTADTLSSLQVWTPFGLGGEKTQSGTNFFSPDLFSNIVRSTDQNGDTQSTASFDSFRVQVVATGVPQEFAGGGGLGVVTQSGLLQTNGAAFDPSTAQPTTTTIVPPAEPRNIEPPRLDPRGFNPDPNEATTEEERLIREFQNYDDLASLLKLNEYYREVNNAERSVDEVIFSFHGWMELGMIANERALVRNADDPDNNVYQYLHAGNGDPDLGRQRVWYGTNRRSYTGPYLLDYLSANQDAGKDFGVLGNDTKAPAPPPGAPPVDSATSAVARASDPNDIVGPGGVGADGFLTATTDPLSYRIRFENQATATAPAREVVVTQTVDPDFNFASFQFAEVGFAGTVVKVPAGLSSYSNRVDRTADLGVYVDVTLDFDATSGRLTAILRAIDPVTFDLVAEADRGFLLPNDATGRGDGYILYSAKPKANLATGTRLDARARIVFDTEAPIDTPPIFNTIDATAPTATVSVGPYLTPTAIPLSWSGADVGAGVATYDVFVSTDGGPFQPFRDNTAATFGVFAGAAGHTYRFRVVATDAVGNVQSAPGIAQVTTAALSGLRVEIDAPRTVRVGDEAIFKFKVRGPGHNEQLTFRIDWDGDNIVDEVISGQSNERVSHVFAAPGEYRVQVVVVDANGRISEVASESVRATARPTVAVANGTLVITGTDDNNRIEVRRRHNAVVVEIDGEEFGPFTGLNEIRADALGGDDRITINEDVQLAAILDGGDGDDVIRGGGGDTAQLGGAGNDRLLGGHGRNILIGGTGADELRGRDGSDILIGGTTAYDRDREKLRALLTAWTRAESYADRVRALRDPSNPIALTANTVQNDDAVDELFGGGDSDWFFGSTSGPYVDRTDARPGEARG